MSIVLLAAKGLSAAALLALAAALVDLWRRSSVPVFSYGTLTLSQRRLKSLWVALLLGALVVGSSNNPVLRFTDDSEEAAPSASQGMTATYSVNVPLPFYRYERTTRWVNGTRVEEHILEGLVLPWSFLWALLAYYVLVVRWNPDSRLAKRILGGRKASGGAT